jgi:hypothetical protein
MSTFPIRDDEYSVEEISYDDFMYAVSIQEHSVSPSEKTMNEDKSGSQLYRVSAVNDTETTPSSPHDLEKRLADNANRALPDWLLNG